jgi:hypothetical protein
MLLQHWHQWFPFGRHAAQPLRRLGGRNNLACVVCSSDAGRQRMLGLVWAITDRDGPRRSLPNRVSATAGPREVVSGRMAFRPHVILWAKAGKQPPPSGANPQRRAFYSALKAVYALGMPPPRGDEAEAPTVIHQLNRTALS